jgi:hypothetical protein
MRAALSVVGEQDDRARLVAGGDDDVLEHVARVGSLSMMIRSGWSWAIRSGRKISAGSEATMS